MLARSLPHATGRGVDHRANPARLGVERILKCHDNSLANDSYQRLPRASTEPYPLRRRVTLFARQTHSYHADTHRVERAARLDGSVSRSRHRSRWRIVAIDSPSSAGP